MTLCTMLTHEIHVETLMLWGIYSIFTHGQIYNKCNTGTSSCQVIRWSPSPWDLAAADLNQVVSFWPAALRCVHPACWMTAISSEGISPKRLAGTREETHSTSQKKAFPVENERRMKNSRPSDPHLHDKNLLSDGTINRSGESHKNWYFCPQSKDECFKITKWFI